MNDLNRLADILTHNEMREYIEEKIIEPFIVVYRSEPFEGICGNIYLELIGKNEEYFKEG